MMKAIAAVLVLLGMGMISGATPHAPQTRAPVYEPYRMSWAELKEDLRRRKAFRRTFRMPEESFVKLADLLRPALQKNERFVREYDIAVYEYVRVRVLCLHLKSLAARRLQQSF